jgi:putative hydrolase of the HAD superfamily
MILKADSNSYFVFDLDDTLYFEIDFLKSAFKSISLELEADNHGQLLQKMLEIYNSGGNTFDFLVENYSCRNITTENLLSLYRNHYPEISLRGGVLEMFIKIKNNNGRIGIITDGRSISQRNKIKALGIERYIDKILISEEFGFEKPDSSVFESFMSKAINEEIYYFGDNIRKDFISPKKLFWCCIGVLGEKSLLKFKLSDFSEEYLPHFFINDFTEIEIV